MAKGNYVLSSWNVSIGIAAKYSKATLRTESKEVAMEWLETQLFFNRKVALSFVPVKLGKIKD